MTQYRLDSQNNSADISYYLSSISKEEKKALIDSLVDPVFVISNANEMLRVKLEKFVDGNTKEYMYMIERAQKKITQTINILKLWLP